MKKFALCCLCLLVLAVAGGTAVFAGAGELAAGPEELQGRPGFHLLTVYANPFDKKAINTKSDFEKRTREKLLSLGLPLITRDQAEKLPGKPRLLVLIGVLPQPFCGPSLLFEIEIKFQEEFVRVRKPRVRARKTVWLRRQSGLIAQPDVSGLDMVEDALYLLDVFITKYKAANKQ
ncbi:MAG: hypothetical protein SV487_06665 [Thermodesulfobacteriota bacterium]|nr:hypothetical protein [Thermodesulfobacteriota bacterium]